MHAVSVYESASHQAARALLCGSVQREVEYWKPGNVSRNLLTLIDERGQHAGVVQKIGLTPAEETFLARGSARSAVELLGHRTTAVLCREIDDLEHPKAELWVRFTAGPNGVGTANIDGADTSTRRPLGRRSASKSCRRRWTNSCGLFRSWRASWRGAPNCRAASASYRPTMALELPVHLRTRTDT